MSHGFEGGHSPRMAARSTLNLNLKTAIMIRASHPARPVGKRKAWVGDSVARKAAPSVLAAARLAALVRLEDSLRCLAGCAVGAGTTRNVFRYGCFLPDLTGLANAASARLPRRIWRGRAAGASRGKGRFTPRPPPPHPAAC